MKDSSNVTNEPGGIYVNPIDFTEIPKDGVGHMYQHNLECLTNEQILEECSKEAVRLDGVLSLGAAAAMEGSDDPAEYAIGHAQRSLRDMAYVLNKIGSS